MEDVYFLEHRGWDWLQLSLRGGIFPTPTAQLRLLSGLGRAAASG